MQKAQLMKVKSGAYLYHQVDSTQFTHRSDEYTTYRNRNDKFRFIKVFYWRIAIINILVSDSSLLTIQNTIY